MSQRRAQLEYEHTMLVRHHESTQDLEYKQLAALQKCKDEQLKRQHETEKDNQREYNTRAEAELRKKHALEVKQQPRSLKVCVYFFKFHKQWHPSIRCETNCVIV